MRIGVTLPVGAPDGPGRLPTWRGMHAFAAHAEAIGLDFALGCDHFLSGPAGRPAEAIHEGWAIVAALAASTSTIELGQLVMRVSFRSPALLAKMAVTADGVSGGRLVLGLGAGWYDREYLAFGFPADHRVARFEEALQVIGSLLRGERLTFSADFHAADSAQRSGEFVAEGPASPPGDGGLAGEAGVAQDGCEGVALKADGDCVLGGGDLAGGFEEAPLDGVGSDACVSGEPGAQRGEEGLGEEGEHHVEVDVEVDRGGQGVGAEGADDL